MLKSLPLDRLDSALISHARRADGAPFRAAIGRLEIIVTEEVVWLSGTVLDVELIAKECSRAGKEGTNSKQERKQSGRVSC